RGGAGGLHRTPADGPAGNAGRDRRPRRLSRQCNLHLGPSLRHRRRLDHLTRETGQTTVTIITGLETHDLRFPTSLSLDGSDAMNPDPDYSAAYVVLKTDAEGLEGHGLTFTIGRGNDICCAGI